MYAVKQDMIDRFGQEPLLQATDLAQPPAGAINDQVLNTVLDDAQAEIDGYLAARYPLPFTDVPVVLKRWACDVAWYLLLGDKASEQVIKRYETIVKSLRAINAGELTLGTAASSSEVPTESSSVRIAGSTRVFDDDTLADY